MYCTRTTSTFTFYIYYFTFYISKKVSTTFIISINLSNSFIKKHSLIQNSLIHSLVLNAKLCQVVVKMFIE